MGDNPFTVEYRRAYTDPGATSTDNTDGSLPVSINIDNIDVSQLGNYTVVFNATDNAGNIATLYRTVVIKDSTAPVFLYNGVETTNYHTSIVFSTTDNYTLSTGVTVNDNLDVGLTDFISKINDVEIQEVARNIIKTYTIEHTYTDIGSNTSVLNGLITIIDVTAPEIIVQNDNPYTVELSTSDSYEDLETAINDDEDPNVTVTVNTDDVIMSVVGTYSVKYTATDASGNIAQTKYRTVVIASLRQRL